MKKQLPSTYYEYKKALLELVVLNGNSALSERQIQQFIDQNDLHSRFRITTVEVKKDVSMILGPNMFGTILPPVYELPEYQLDLRKELLPKASEGLSDYEITQFIKSKEYLKLYINRMEVDDVRIHMERLVNGKWVQSQITPSKLFQTNKVYQNALRLRLRDDNKEPLSEISIKVFIKRGGFDKSCGLDVETVRRDMYSLLNKHNVMTLCGANVAHEQRENDINLKMANTTKQHPSVCSAVQTVPTVSEYTFDEHMRNTLFSALKEHSEVLLDRHRVSGLLKDLFPGHRREVNILLQIYDLGIVEELKKQKEVDPIFLQRFTTKVVNEYGTAEKLAESMVLLWCYCFGQGLCQIKCDL